MMGDTVHKVREFLTRSRLTAAIGLLTVLFGLLEVRGTFSHLAEPWATVVVCIGAALTWAGRSGLAEPKPAAPPEEGAE
jgi:drug/metabolite transporter (DMT)-like permease